MASKSLWADLTQVGIDRTPRTILMEQAQYLTESTRGKLVGSVGEGRSSDETFTFSLNVRVPSLNEYLVNILTIEHGIDLYPVRLGASRPPTNVTCSDEADFERKVGSVLSSPEVAALLSRLLSFVR